MGILDYFRPTAAPEPIAVQKAAGDITTTHQLAMMLDPIVNNGFSGTFDYAHNVNEAYMKNPTAFYCFNLIADAACQPRWELYLNDNEVEVDPGKNPLSGPYRFIQRPNDTQSLTDFVRLYLIHFYLAGEAFIYMLPDAKAFARGNGKLVLLPPNKVSIDKDHYIIDGKTRIPKVNPDGSRDILHIKEWHPHSDRGMSRLQPAWGAISNINQAQKWNLSVLMNSAKLSLVAILKSFGTDKGSTLSQEQLAELNADLEKFATGKGRGKPFVGTGDWDFKELGMNNKDLEWLKGMEAMKRDIALAFGIDPVLLSLPGDSTYSNKEMAYSNLYKTVALPRLSQLIESLEHWFKQSVPGDWEFRINQDDVTALEPDREKKWSRQRDAADILLVDERRELLGYEPLPNGAGQVIGSAKPEEAPTEPEAAPTTEEPKPADEDEEPTDE